jgi:hypothetical protein
MADSNPRRVPENSAGDFYVVAGFCMRCCLPHGEAPNLMNDPDAEFKSCFFRRQPETPDEVEQAISAMHVSEVAALRYGGTDDRIITRLCSKGMSHLCDKAKNP